MSQGPAIHAIVVCYHPDVAAVPILSGEQVLGVLNAESSQRFSAEDAATLEIVADHLAAPIVNARLTPASTLTCASRSFATGMSLNAPARSASSARARATRCATSWR